MSKSTRLLSSQLVLALVVFVILFASIKAQTKLAGACRINQFRCNDGSRCLTLEKLCNGKKDCSSGEDELGSSQWDCSKSTLATECDTRHEYECRFGGCISREKICDGRADCWGGIDESIEACTQRVRQRPSQSVTTSSKPKPRPISNTQPPAPTPRPAPRPTPRPVVHNTPPPPPAGPVPHGSCPPLRDEIGYKIECQNEYGRRVSCDSPLPESSTATYSCRQYYVALAVGSSTTRTCRGGQWTTKRQNFICSLQCGIGGHETVSLVTGGVTSKKGKWPWHVGLFQQDPPNSGKWQLQCGGSLISPTAILTAAHCVTRKSTSHALDPKDIQVMAGKFYRKFDEREPDQQKRGVRRIVKHEEYNDYNLDNDIAILFLDQPVEINNFARPVCVPNLDNTYDSSPEKKGFLVGWGRGSGGKFQRELQEAEIPVVDSGVCRNSHPTFATLVRTTTFCAGYRNGTSACDGDSGGGLVFLDDSRRHFKVHGIVSAGVAKGTGGCQEDYYAVFTRVLHYEVWISKTLDEYTKRK